MRIGVCSGGFDPIHSGHIDYLNDAKSRCDWLIVGLNSDEWLARKKGKPFMNWEERCYILSQIRAVEGIMGFDDSDDSACDLINKVAATLPPTGEILFMNGGDRTKENIPEMKLKSDVNVKFIFGVGGNYKRNSSSKLLSEWTKNDSIQRVPV